MRTKYGDIPIDSTEIQCEDQYEDVFETMTVIYRCHGSSLQNLVSLAELISIDEIYLVRENEAYTLYCWCGDSLVHSESIMLKQEEVFYLSKKSKYQKTRASILTLIWGRCIL